MNVFEGSQQLQHLWCAVCESWCCILLLQLMAQLQAFFFVVCKSLDREVCQECTKVAFLWSSQTVIRKECVLKFMCKTWSLSFSLQIWTNRNDDWRPGTPRRRSVGALCRTASNYLWKGRLLGGLLGSWNCQWNDESLGKPTCIESNFNYVICNHCRGGEPTYPPYKVPYPRLLFGEILESCGNPPVHWFTVH